MWTSVMLKNFVLASSLYFFCLIIIGLYTIIIYFVGHGLWPNQAAGSLILDGDLNVRGSYLISQDLKGDKYFKMRSYVKFDHECDVALYNPKVKRHLIDKYDEAQDRYDISMMTPSISFDDPFITRREALHQALKIAKVRGKPIEEIYKLIDENTLYSQAPFFELDIVNALLLNSRLDEY